MGRVGLTGLLLIVAAGAVALLAGYWEPTPPRAGPCRQEISVIADDGRLIAADLYRCDPGQGPALLVWQSSRRRSGRLVTALDRWARGGRSLWVVRQQPEPATLRGDWDAVIEAMAEDRWVDDEHIAALLDEKVLPALLDRPAREPGIGALVIASRRRPPVPQEPGRIRVAWIRARSLASAAQEADRWLGEVLLGEGRLSESSPLEEGLPRR